MIFAAKDANKKVIIDVGEENAWKWKIAKSVYRPYLQREQLQRSLAKLPKQQKPARALTQLNDLPYWRSWRGMNRSRFWLDSYYGKAEMSPELILVIS